MGGMAEIHLAEQSGPGGFKKRLVIKRILPHLVGDEKFLQMFQDEARVAAVLNHPNIVQIFELGQEDESYYIAMEYVSGFNLRSVIQICSENGLWLAPEYIAKLGSQICEGLEYAHSFCDADGNHLNLIHRDVSPQNIILSMQGIIKIVDFGIAKAKSTQETQAGTIKGKLAYMSPEQVKGLTLDRRSDIFSLGIVLYELATYGRPFHGKSDIDMLRAILNAPPIPIQQIRPDFPEDLSNIINRALAKNRDERYQSSRELQWDLEQFIQNWRKPIGPFQLQELVQKLDEMEKRKNPSEAIAPTTHPHHTPAPPSHSAPPPHNDSDDYADAATIWGNDPPDNSHAEAYAAPQQAYAQTNQGGGYQASWSQPASPASAPAAGWGAAAAPASQPIEEWEDDDATVLSMSPPVGGYNAAALGRNAAPTFADPIGRPQNAPTIADNASSLPAHYLQPPTAPNHNQNGPAWKDKPQAHPSSAPTQIGLEAAKFQDFALASNQPKKSKTLLISILAFFLITGTVTALYFFVLR